MDDLLVIVIVAASAFFVGVGFGVASKGEIMVADCANFGAFAHGGQKFTCAPAGEAK